MTYSAFYSFHFDNDAWRASTIRSIGKIDGNTPVEDNDWESIKRNGDAAVETWIKNQIKGKDVVVVLIGSATASRKWVKREIQLAWSAGLPIIGVRIHRILDSAKSQSSAGANPFSLFTVDGNQLDQLVPVYDAGLVSSTDAYAFIANGIEGWIKSAINDR
jgi:hypothetical protein